MNGQPDCARESQMHQQLDRLRAVVKDLHDGVQAMASALTTVMRTEPSPPSPGTDKIGEELIPHANSVRNIANEIAMANQALIDLRGRLEI